MPRLDHPNIKRNAKEISFEMDGESMVAYGGESVGAALTACGKLDLNKAKNEASRGIFCGMGVCQDCLVEINGSYERACMTKVEPGMKVKTAHYLAKKNNQYSSKELKNESCEVLIIGAGPAGLAAAAKLAEAGVQTTILDERPAPGGQYFKQLTSGLSFASIDKADTQYQGGRSLIQQVEKSGTKLLSGVKVWGAFRQNGQLEITACDVQNNYLFQPKNLILATGAFEPVPLFPGWTLPGVMTTGSAQGLLRSYLVSPGQRLLIVGNGPLNVQLACELANAGVEVVALAELAPSPFPNRLKSALGTILTSPKLAFQGINMQLQLMKHGIKYLYNHTIVEAIGENKVERASIAPLKNGQPNRNRIKEYEIDAVCVGYGFQSVNDIARAIGCEFQLDSRGSMLPITDNHGQASIDGVYIIGDGAKIGGAPVAIAAARVAANAILEETESVLSNADLRLLHKQRRFQHHLWNMFRGVELGTKLATEDTLICRCECVRLGNVIELVQNGESDLGTIKRMTRAGMGRCQGRYCQNHLSNLLKDLTGERPAYGSLFAPQIPIKPVAIEDLTKEAQEWKGYKPAEIDTPSGSIKISEKDLASTDTLIIGAGIVGVCTAYYLTQYGNEVTIVDRGQLNGQASGSNAGSMHLQLLSFDYDLNESDQPSPAELTLGLQKEGVDLWFELQNEIGADFELKKTGGLMVAENEKDLQFLRNKAKAEERQGIEMHILDRAELLKAAPAVSDQMIGGSFCPDEGKINPMLATPVVMDEATKKGANLLENTTVIGIKKVSNGYEVSTSEGTIKCKRIVNTAGGWSPKIAKLVGINLPVQSAPQQMIVTEPAETMIEHLVAHAHRHLTMKQAANGNLIIGGGWFASYDSIAQRPVTQRKSIQGNLWIAQRVIPGISRLNVLRTWAAVGVSIDGAPILGSTPGHPDFYHAVGANGYTMAPIMGKLIAEEITNGEKPKGLDFFRPDRF